MRDRPPADTPWHALDVLDAIRTAGSSAGGLEAREAARRLARDGPNVLPRRGASFPALRRAAREPVALAVLAVAAGAAALGRPLDAALALGALAVPALVAAFHKARAARDAAAAWRRLRDTVRVTRGGVRLGVAPRRLVVGDLVHLAAGDRVPADLRLLVAHGLRVDEAALTGVAGSFARDEAPSPRSAALRARSGMAHGGGHVTAGTALGLVVATGARTELARAAAGAGDSPPPEAVFRGRLAGVRWPLAAGAGVAAAAGAVAFLRGSPGGEALVASLAVAAAAVPEGLPALATVVLALAVRRMAGRGLVVRRVGAVEALGSSTVLLLDKTGTLTCAEPSVQALWTASGTYALLGVGYAPEGALLRGDRLLRTPPRDVVELLRGAVLCGDGAVGREGGRWRAVGDPLDAAVAVAAARAGVQPAAVRAAWRRLDAAPREPAALRTALQADPHGRRWLLVQGDPAAVLPRCRDADGAALEAERMAARGLRVVAVARRGAAGDALDPRELERAPLELLGLVAAVDPPREDAAEAVRRLRAAGVAVKLFTADDPRVAAAVGAAAGIGGPGAAVLTGEDLDRLDDAELAAAARRCEVFAALAPQDKRRLVAALQRAGEVVAVVGDGAGDVPALRQAHAAAVMGSAPPLARSAAGLVLADDALTALAEGVEEGRRTAARLAGAVALLVPVNLGLAALLALAAAAFPSEAGAALLPLLPSQVLWVNLAVASAVALPLAIAARGEAAAAPRTSSPWPGALALGALMALAAAALFALGHDRALPAGEVEALAAAKTAAVTGLVVVQACWLAAARGPRLLLGRGALAGAAALVALQAALVHLPPLQAVFATAPLDAASWLAALAAGAAAVPVAALADRTARRAPGGRAVPPVAAGSRREEVRT